MGDGGTTGITGAFLFAARKGTEKGNDGVTRFLFELLAWAVGKGYVLANASARRRCAPERFAFRKLREALLFVGCPLRSALGVERAAGALAPLRAGSLFLRRLSGDPAQIIIFAQLLVNARFFWPCLIDTICRFGYNEMEYSDR